MMSSSSVQLSGSTPIIPQVNLEHSIEWLLEVRMIEKVVKGERAAARREWCIWMSLRRLMLRIEAGKSIKSTTLSCEGQP